jgi:hypothetical protein
MTILVLLIAAFFQNVAFTLVSRARNRNVWQFHAIASTMSNGVWFATFHILIVNGMSWRLFIPYSVATTLGSLTGAAVAARIERWLGATSDGHLAPKPMTEMELVRKLASQVKN